MKKLSALLTERYGAGWSYPLLKNIRQFYLVYSKRLHTVYPIQNKKDNHRNKQLYLPDKSLLQAKLREWIADFEENKREEDEQ